MGRFENSGNLTPEQELVTETSKEEMLDQAVKGGKEIIVKELKEAQKLSDDEMFQNINIDGLDGAVLIGLHKIIKHYERNDPFPEEVMDKARKFYFENNSLLDGDSAYQPVRPENEIEFLKGEIIKRADVFSSDIDPQFHYAETKEQGIAQPDTRA